MNLFTLFRNDFLFDQLHVGLEDVIGGYEVELELEEFQEFFFSLQDALLRKGTVGDLFWNYTGV